MAGGNNVGYRQERIAMDMNSILDVDGQWDGEGLGSSGQDHDMGGGGGHSGHWSTDINEYWDQQQQAQAQQQQY